MELIFLLIIAVILPIYLKAEYEKKFNKATTLKLILTFMVISITILSLILWGINVYTQIILIALIFALLGDYFMQFININAVKYNYGIICFGICQLILLIGITIWYEFIWWGLLVSAALFVVSILILRPLSIDFGINKVPLMIYSMLLSLVAGQSCAAFIINVNVASGALFFGSLLFFSSDVLLGYWKYLNNKWWIVFACWICYFYGIALIALSTYWL